MTTMDIRKAIENALGMVLLIVASLVSGWSIGYPMGKQMTLDELKREFPAAKTNTTGPGETHVLGVVQEMKTDAAIANRKEKNDGESTTTGSAATERADSSSHRETTGGERSIRGGARRAGVRALVSAGGEGASRPVQAVPEKSGVQESIQSRNATASVEGAASKVAQAPVYDTEFENLCPSYRHGPCSDTPHTKLQCGDPLVTEMKATASVWEVWCMQGNVQVCVAGRWPPPEGKQPCEVAR